MIESALHRNGRASVRVSWFVLSPLSVLAVSALLSTAILAGPHASAAGPLSSPVSSIFTPEVQFWSASIVRWAAGRHLNANLVAVVMQIESCGDPFARSGAGALGLFQVMPSHFADSEDPYEPDTNAARGLVYLDRSLASAGFDARLALAGYNGGIALISQAESNWPSETLRYAYWGSGIYADALNGATRSDRLAEWLAAGGDGLCSQARHRLHLGS
jgi:soluble lytic murein transglycosylase-like protein